MRLSATQKDTLFVLYALELGGKTDPAPAVDLLKLVNKGRDVPVFSSNFRASCDIMKNNSLLSKYRSQSLQSAFRLTEKGRELAKAIYEQRIAELKEADHGPA